MTLGGFMRKDPAKFTRIWLTKPMNEYEAKRQLRVQQNNAMLRSLQMESIPKRPTKRARSLTRKQDNTTHIRRRSPRLSQHTTSHDDELLVQDTIDTTKAPAITAYDVPIDLPNIPILTLSNQELFSKKTYKLADLTIDLDVFHTDWIGKQLWPKGKQFVVEGICKRSVVFSKMSGIQCWKYGIILYVNILSEGYDNIFTETDDGQVYFRWFAQARQHEQSPAIQRLVSATRGDTTLWLDGSVDVKSVKSDAKSEPILLFVRSPNGPYVYCGRLGYLGHRINNQPYEFRWQLLDVAHMVSWKEIKIMLHLI